MRTPATRAIARLISCVLASVILTGSAHASYVYWLQTTWGSPTLERIDGGGDGPVTMALPAGSLPEGLALDAAHRQLFWTEAAWTGARLRRCDLSLTDVVDVSTGWSVLRGLAMHPESGQLYATSSNLAAGSAIRRWNNDGTGATAITSLGPAANPRGIAIDVAGGRMLWADFAGSAIATAPLAGTPISIFHGLPPGGRPWGVAIDSAAGQVYWTDWANGTISRRALSGGAATTVLGGLSNPSWLALDPTAGRMYWIDAGTGTLRRSAMSGGPITTLVTGLPTTGGMVFVPSSVYVGAEPGAPGELAFAIRSANPARGAVTVECALPADTRVRVQVLDVQGRECARLADGVMTAGRHVLTWPPGGAAAGVYFVRFEGAGRTLARRVSITR